MCSIMHFSDTLLKSITHKKTGIRNWDINPEHPVLKIQCMF